MKIYDIRLTDAQRKIILASLRLAMDPMDGMAMPSARTEAKLVIGQLTQLTDTGMNDISRMSNAQTR